MNWIFIGVAILNINSALTNLSAGKVVPAAICWVMAGLCLYAAGARLWRNR